MDVYEVKTLHERLAGNRYPGRGIVIGKTPRISSLRCMIHPVLRCIFL